MTFKVRLLLGAAAPFVFSLPALAQVSVSTATTTPLQTTNANAGAASDITITSTGTIAPTTANTTAVTVNSSNDVVNNGAINFNNLNDTVGVRLLPGFTGSYSGTGSISLLEDYVRDDDTSDTDTDETDGPIAEGSNRYGILLAPGGTFTGDIRIDNTNNVATAQIKGGSITVEGNNSAGVSLQSDLVGSYVQNGFVTVTGTNAVGVDLRGDVSGNVQIGSEAITTGTAGVGGDPVLGGVSVRGEGAVGVRVLGNVGGEFMIDGGISATGFAQPTLSNYQDPDDPAFDTNNEGLDEPDALDPDDLLVGGSAVEIRGDLAFGFLVNGNAVGVPDTTADVKDVVQNFNENRSTGSISSTGSAPALLIQSADGAAGDALVLSRVRETIIDNLDDDDDDNVTETIATFNYDYGFINRGVISANGQNVGFSATAARIAGSADGAHTTTIEGGIFNGNSINATSFEADASGLVIGSGAITPQLINNGVITAVTNTETTHDANGVRIEVGAQVDTVTNNGLIFSSVDSYDADAVAFQDLSGSVDTFTNTSRITAGFLDDDTTDTITDGPGRTVAIDLSHNAGNVVITQTDAIDNARMLGDVLMGVGSDTFNLLSGQVFGDVDFGAGGTDTFNLNSATLNGDATFRGAGANLNFNGGLMAGDIALNNTTGSLSFANGSNYLGEITRTGAGAMSLNVNNSTVNNVADGTLNLSSLTFANGAQIGISIDNARIAGNVPNFNVTGVADIAANTEFAPIFDQFTNQTFTLRVLNAGTLNLGGPLSGMIAQDGPFLYNMNLVQPNANAIDLVLEVKDAQELGLNTRQAGAYAAVLDLMEEEDGIAAAVTSISTADAFQRSWSDLLPANDASVLRILATNASAAFGATANRLDMISNKPDAPGGAWTEEFGVYHTADPSADSVGISGGGFGVAAGIDLVSTGTALVGAFLSLESAEMEEEDRSAAPLNVAQTAVGLYGGWINGNLAINGAASYGFIDFTSDREVVIGTLADRLKGEWKGQSYSASARATYTVPMGWLDVKPFVGADFTGFQQDGYQETAQAFDGLEIVAGDSDASLATGSYGLQLVGNLGGDDAYSIHPELSVGYRNILNWDATPAQLAFAGGATGSTFTLDPGVEPEDAIVAGLGFTIDSQFLNIKLGYDTEISDTATTHYGSVTLRMAFW
jgi:uncharacterized protein with beta-barrel porin domain